MPAVIRLDAREPALAMLIPFAAQRIEQYAADYQPEVEPKDYAAAVISRLWLADPRIYMAGIIDESSAKLLGHVLAIAEQAGTATSVLIAQVRADQNVGDARVQAVEAAMEWARELGVSRIFLATNRDGKEWEKRLGFKSYRHLLRLPIDGNGNGHAA